MKIKMAGLNNQGGFVMLLVLVVLGALFFLGTRMVLSSRRSVETVGALWNYTSVKMCAQEKASLAVNQVAAMLEAGTPIHDTVFTCDCASSGNPNITARVELNIDDPQTGQGCYNRVVTQTDLSVKIRCGNDQSHSVKLQEEIVFSEYPLFQFALFSNDTLDLLPGPVFHIWGKTHANGDIRFSPISASFYHDWITTPNDMLIRYKYGTSAVTLARMDGTIDVVKTPGPVFLPNSMAYAVTDWANFKPAHRVAYGSEANGCGTVKQSELPIKDADPRTIIEWRDTPIPDPDFIKKEKLAWKAGAIFKASDNTWYDNDLTLLSMQPTPPVPIPANHAYDADGRVTIYNYHDSILLHLVPVDIRKVSQLVCLQMALPKANRIAYLYDTRPDGGFFLYNGSLVDSSLTIVTNNRMFVQGNVNTAPPIRSMALIGDRVMLLSNKFRSLDHQVDRDRTQFPRLKDSTGASTTYNACMMTGFGLRNNFYPTAAIRLIENWEDVTLTITGSIVSMWNQAYGASTTIGTRYYPPFRNFAFDNMYNQYANMPPGTPRLVTPGLIDWEMSR